MPPDNITVAERVVRVETKVEMLLDLMREIREDLKDNPSREEFKDLKEDVDELKRIQAELDKRNSLMFIKLGTVSGILGVFGGIFINYLIKLLLG